VQNWAICLTIIVAAALIGPAPAIAQPPKIWVFKTHLTGALNQRLGVASRLSSEVEVMEMPGKESGMDLTSFMAGRNDWPDLILHTEDWRHELDFLLDLVQKAPKKVGLVYLENPKSRQTEIDLLVNPTHQPLVSGANVMRTVGVPSHITKETLASAKTAWQSRLSWMPQPLTLVILGGDSLHNLYRPDFAADFGTRLRAAIQKTGGSMLITTTRRTPKDQVLSALVNELRGLTIQIYDWHRDQDIDNPYIGGLAMASHVVASGDSMSMLSDVVLAGKPLYIHAPMNSVLPEHSRLIEDLYVQGKARPFTGKELKSWDYLPVDVAADIAAEVRKRFPCQNWLLPGGNHDSN
jgi:uncharacterized protein